MRARYAGPRWWLYPRDDGVTVTYRKGDNRTNDYDVFMKLVSEMFSEADIDNRKAEIAQFNKVTTYYSSLRCDTVCIRSHVAIEN